MTETFYELVDYIKRPFLQEDENKNFNYRLKKFLHLLLISLITGLVSLTLIGLVDELGWVNLEEDHKASQLMKEMPKYTLLLMAVVLAPLLEEAIFRAPLTAFKKGQQFRIAFYVIAVLFGFVHITNYEMSTNILLLSPILVLPQILLGFYLGFIRVRFGLLWAIALHSLYNGVLTVGSFLGESI